VARRSLTVLLLSALFAGCGGHQTRHATTSPRAAPATLGDGRVIAVDRARRLFVTCTGSGRPTVVLEAGFPGDSENWRDVLPELGRTTLARLFAGPGVRCR
jgi:pimeloyl-ACP methyl ester carboxylesterase